MTYFDRKHFSKLAKVFCLFMSYIEWLWSWNHQRETLMFYRSRQQMIIWKWAANEKHKTMNKKFSFSYYVCDFPILITSNTCKAANSCKAASVIKISCTTLENWYTTIYLFYHFYVMLADFIIVIIHIILHNCFRFLLFRFSFTMIGNKKEKKIK